jgi:hypothetical protein
LDVVAIDNDGNLEFFGPEASTVCAKGKLEKTHTRYRHRSIDIPSADGVKAVFREHESPVKFVVHTASQQSHHWAPCAQVVIFGVNGVDTVHLLEATRTYWPEADFNITNTNTACGDKGNLLPLVKLAQIENWSHGLALGLARRQVHVHRQSKHSYSGQRSCGKHRTTLSNETSIGWNGGVTD